MAMMQQTGTALLIILALGIIGLGVQGMCLSTKCAYLWCIKLWGCSLCCASMLVFIFGCLFAASNSMVGGYINGLCMPKDAFASAPIYVNSNSADTGMGKILNANMCTSSCPCVATANITLPNNTYYGGRSTASLVKTGSIKTFQECYQTVLAPQETDNQKKATMTSYLAMMKTLETKFACSGICQPAMTFYTQDVSGRQPAGGCKQKTLEVIGGGYTVPGFILIFSSLIIYVIFIVQCGFWFDRKEPMWKNR